MLVFNQNHQSNINTHINTPRFNLSKPSEEERTHHLKRLLVENKEYLKNLGFKILTD